MEIKKESNRNLYINLIVKVDHGVFCVGNDGKQKNYYDAAYNKRTPFSSAQQMKRSIIDKVNEVLGEKGTTWYFNKVVETGKGSKEKISDGTVHSDCDPVTHTEDLLRGNMKTSDNKVEGDHKVSRRSPFSIGSMVPLNPELVSLNSELLVNDSRERENKLNFWDKNGNSKDPDEDQRAKTSATQYLPDGVDKVSGIFQFNMSLNIEKLVTINIDNDEIGSSEEKLDDIINKAKKNGWKEVTLSNGDRGLIMSQDKINELVDAVSYSILNWRIGSNQSLGFDPMRLSIISVGYNDQKVYQSITTKQNEESNNNYKRRVCIYDSNEVDTYLMPAANEVLSGEDPHLKDVSLDGLENAQEQIKNKIMNGLDELFDF